MERTETILKQCRTDFKVYSGDDATALALMTKGASGVISVSANVAPEKMHSLCEAIFKRDLSLAEKINSELKLLHEYLFLESNPIPVKWALQQMKKIPTGIRLPLLPLDKLYHEKVKKAMQLAGVYT